jgi:hypothetical protein
LDDVSTYPPSSEVASMKDDLDIRSEAASCINIENLIKFGMEEVFKNEMKGAAVRHRVR